MKKVVKQIALLCSAFLLATCVFTACGDGNTGGGNGGGGGNNPTTSEWTNGALAGFELPHSEGQANSDGLYDYNSDLFYLNETRLVGADPGAMYVSPENIEYSYEQLLLSKKYLNDVTGEYEWIKGWDLEKVEEEYGTLAEWQKEYGNMYYYIGTGYGWASSGQYNIGHFPMTKSNDLTNWELCGPVGGSFAVGINSSSDWASVNHGWAPEFFKDEETGLYYIWGSMCSQNGNNNNTTFSPNYDTFGAANQWEGLTISCFISEHPGGPYRCATTKEIIEYQAQKDKNGNVILGKETYIEDITKTVLKPQYSRSTATIKVNEVYSRSGKHIGYKALDGTYYNLSACEITSMEPVFNIPYYYPRLATNMDKVNEFIDTYHITNIPGFAESTLDKAIFPAIDVNPVMDENGNKYIYFTPHVCQLNNKNQIWVVKMIDWLTPDWSTMTCIAAPGALYITQDGTLDGKIEVFTSWYDGEVRYDADGKEITNRADYDKTVSIAGGINEGAEVIFHKGKCYLTYSPFGYGSRYYSSYVAVSNDPLGIEEPFVKAGEEYSPIIGIGTEYNDYMSGTGHHVIFEAGDELFFLYHCHLNPTNNTNGASGSFESTFLGRAIGIDRVYWKYVPELGYDMMFGNGPTYNLQPKPETYTGLTNVGKYATITGNGDVGETEYLKDGMITAQPFARKYEYGKKDGGLEIHYKWDSPVKINALMVYNAGGVYEAFKSVTSVVFKLSMRPAWYNLTQYNGYCYIDGINCDPNDFLESGDVMRKGGAAIAEFNEIEVTEMYLYISGEADNKYKTEHQDVYGENKEVHVSEIYIFGNKA